MKIITWNCQMRFRDKSIHISPELPDILIVPECEQKELLNFGFLDSHPTSRFWFGDNPRKGLGVFSYTNYEIKFNEDLHNPNFKYFIPLTISNGAETYKILAIWVKSLDDSFFYDYAKQVHEAIYFYEKFLEGENVMLIGDFNSNGNSNFQINNHNNFVAVLKRIGIHSTYHSFFKENHGSELQNTFYQGRNKSKPFHIDYCFASTNLINRIKSIKIGKYEEWANKSDHMPMILEIDSEFNKEVENPHIYKDEKFEESWYKYPPVLNNDELFIRGKMLMELSKYGLALIAFEQLDSSFYSNNMDLHYYKAICFKEVGMIEKSKEEYLIFSNYVI